MSSICQLFLCLVISSATTVIAGEEATSWYSVAVRDPELLPFPAEGDAGSVANQTADECGTSSASEQTGNTSSGTDLCPWAASTSVGPRDPGLPDEHQYILIALYTATTALAVTGNMVVIVVLSVGRRSRTDLRAFLLNLAVADLTMAAFCMPFTFTTTMLHDWIFGAVMCTVVLFVQVGGVR